MRMKRLLCALTLFAFGAAPALADPKSDLMAAMINLQKAGTYHISFMGKDKQKMDGDFAMPSKMHMYSPQMEMIKIDNTVWMKIGGQWRQMNIPGVEAMTASVTGAMSMAHGQADDFVVTDLGMKAPLSGGPALHAYTMTNKAGKSPATAFVDGTVLKEIDNADGGTVTFSKIGVPVDISPPN
jgi:hypothetical protein